MFLSKSNSRMKWYAYGHCGCWIEKQSAEKTEVETEKLTRQLVVTARAECGMA